MSIGGGGGVGGVKGRKGLQSPATHTVIVRTPSCALQSRVCIRIKTVRDLSLTPMEYVARTAFCVC